ncbi:hypothetical protein GF340_00955 [Candidatus Peregrinibacteria bacterium]|nr:hypothetical protein [Candidatus Peregrinibacteria bacterium]
MKKTMLKTLAITIIATTVLAQTAGARILFQDDDFDDVYSDGILLDSDGSGSVNTEIQFGNDAIPAENGVIEWDIVTNSFNFTTGDGTDTTVNVDGDLNVSGDLDITNLTPTGVVDLTGATSVQLKETSDHTTEACTVIGEVIFNTANNNLYACTVVGTPGTWAQISQETLDEAYAADNDGTITTNNGNFGVDAGTGSIDFDSSAFDLTTTGNATIGTGGSFSVTSGGTVTFTDANITGVQLSVADTAWTGTFATVGIVDNMNDLREDVDLFYSTANGEGASLVGIDSTATYTNFSPLSNDVQSALEAIDLALGSTNNARNEVLVFNPEYPDAVVHQDLTNNKGKLESEFDTLNDVNFYRWTTKKPSAQDIDVRFRFPLPSDFNDINDFTIDYRLGNAAEDQVDVTVRNATDDDICGTVSGTTVGGWQTATIAEATLEGGCVFDPEDLIEVSAKLTTDNSASARAEVGSVSIGYDN